MPALTLQQFLGAGPDMEGARYRIMGGLTRIRDSFARNSIYPHLGELIELHGTLRTIKGQFDIMRASLPGEIEDIDLDAQELIYRPAEVDFGPMGPVQDLISWALPLMKNAIEEGRTIFEFVDEQMHLEEVGIIPSYVEEGYLIVPDLEGAQVHVLRYTLSIVTSADERYRSLRTDVVKKMPRQSVLPPQHIKLMLVGERPDLPNPATYFVDSELDFPYESTVLPVAKRKLMRYLSDQGGVA